MRQAWARPERWGEGAGFDQVVAREEESPPLAGVPGAVLPPAAQERPALDRLKAFHRADARISSRQTQERSGARRSPRGFGRQQWGGGARNLMVEPRRCCPGAPPPPDASHEGGYPPARARSRQAFRRWLACWIHGGHGGFDASQRSVPFVASSPVLPVIHCPPWHAWRVCTWRVTSHG